MKTRLLAGTFVLALTAVAGVVAAPAHAASYTYTGRAVDSATGNPLKGVLVSARNVVDRTINYAHTRTAADGTYRLTGVPEEEVGLKFNGSDVDHETGWQSCTHTVVQQWGNACSWGPGSNGRAKLQRI